MTHTGAVSKVLCLSSMFVFDVSLPDRHIAGRVVYGFEVPPSAERMIVLSFNILCNLNLIVVCKEKEK